LLATHDPVEAALLSDELVLLVAGRVLQAGPTPHVLAHPASPTAARLLGIRNVGHGVVEAPGVLRAGALSITVSGAVGPPGTAVTWCVPPEEISLTDPNGHPATVLDAVQIGPVVELVVELAGGGELTVTTPAGPAPRVGQSCRVSLPPDAVTVWPSTDSTGIMAAWPTTSPRSGTT
jgi:ABC-type sulfate/molybdate transport systems ATPase subunit